MSESDNKFQDELREKVKRIAFKRAKESEKEMTIFHSFPEYHLHTFSRKGTRYAK